MDTTVRSAQPTQNQWFEPVNQAHKTWAGRSVWFFAATTLAFILWRLFRTTEAYDTLVNDSVQVITFLGATLLTWKLVRNRKLDNRSRFAWFIVSAAYASFTLGQLFWFYYRNALGIDPFPSFVDLCYTAFYPLMLCALLVFPREEQSKTETIKFLLDAATVMIAGTMIVWYFLIWPLIEKNTDPWKTTFNIIFIVGDLVLLAGIMSILLRKSVKGSRQAMMLMVAGLINLLGADIPYAYITLKDIENSGQVIILWITAPFLLMLASYYQLYEIEYLQQAQTDATAEETFRGLTWPPYVAIAVGYGILLYASYGTWGNSGKGLIVGALMLTAVVVLRQIAAVKENMRLQKERTEREGDRRFQTLIQNSSDVVLILDKFGAVLYQSPSVSRELGYSENELIGTKGSGYIHEKDKDAVSEVYQGLGSLKKDEKVSIECRFRHRDGSWRTLDSTFRVVKDESIGLRAVVVNARDITDRKILEEKLRFQAYHDQLTGLGNRFALKEQVDLALDSARKSGVPLAVLFIDLDNFKNINDSLGHEAGDNLIVEVAKRLRRCVRDTNLVVRLGGDEFAVLMENAQQPHAAIAVAERLLNEMSKPFKLGAWEMSIGVSIGISLSDVEGISAEQLLRNADLSMYQAKDKGKNCYAIFQAEMHEDVLLKVELESELRGAIERGEITLNYQPIVNFASGQFSGVEALTRWYHPIKGFIPPMKFIPVAEQSGQIVPLGRWILQKACTQTKKLADKYKRELTVTVNISGLQLQHPEFISDVARILEETEFKPEYLVLEVTETVMMRNTEATLKIINQIKDLGVRVAIDDFGTGYSSLSYLHEFPIDIIKVDRSFVTDMENIPQKHAVAKTIIGLSKTLKMRAVAEGIENKEQLEILRGLGCDYGQGYYFEKPMTIERLDEIIAERQYGNYNDGGNAENFSAVNLHGV